MGNNWITTITGERFEYYSDKPIFELTAIAHSLSQTNRWNGHTVVPINVAAHCCAVAMSDHTPDKYRFEALMHDAVEAYTGDVPTPLKVNLPDFLYLEERLENLCAKHFKLNMSGECLKAVKKADVSALQYERGCYVVKPANIDEVGVVGYDPETMGVNDAGVKHWYMLHHSTLSYSVTDYHAFWKTQFMNLAAKFAV